MGTRKQGGRREMLRADPAPPLTFPTVSPSGSNCFLLRERRRDLWGNFLRLLVFIQER